ncbi:hypothetical protein K7472_31270 [Streptomyces sp. PTM05]|uniref:Lipoprotein n=1 Tax=Streptantibioticus parmotrematis TaxID=2873249 RepID=A0ABS7R437_9ACTN|nr:hypothetical protein [Streptantibioticus parmotrematis]MBY8889290.1 hypothetical protein [Streptantibioticus parmotrematis]
MLVTSGLLLSACTDGAGGSGNAARSTPPPALPSLAAVGINTQAGPPPADPSEAPDGLKPVANLQYGDDELVLYTGGDMCGLTVARTDKPIIQLGTGWPTTTHDGASDLPDGPYQRVSSNATSGPASWAVLRCARDWMSVELQPGQQARLSRAIGPASTVTPTGGANRLVAVISPNQQIRQRVLTKLAS